MSHFEFTVTDEDSGVTYEPWTDSARGGAGIGFKCTHPNGDVEYIFLNPSLGSDDGVPTVFVYQGIHGDPGRDGAAHHYVIDNR